MVINPYADQLEFPAGTPMSLINTILQMNARNRALQEARDAQPEWWENAIAGLIQGGTNQLVLPWLKNEFVNKPYDIFKTDEQIRQFNEIGTNTLNRNRGAAEQDRLREGQALGGYLEGLEGYGEPSISRTGNVSEFGPYDDPGAAPPQFSSPELQAMEVLLNTPGEPGGAVQTQVEPPPQQSIMGSLAPTGESSMTTVSPPQKNTAADAMRLLAGKDPNLAATMAQLLQKNNLFSTIDPLSINKKEMDIASKGAQAEAALTRAQALVDGLTEKARQFDANAPVRSSVVARNEGAGLLSGNRAQIDAAKLQIINNMSKEEQKNWLTGNRGLNLGAMLDGVATELVQIQADPATRSLPLNVQMELAKSRDGLRQVNLTGQRAGASKVGGLDAAHGHLELTGTPAKAYQQAHELMDQLGEMHELIPKVRLEKLLGGIRPWLNDIERRGYISEGNRLTDRLFQGITSDEYEFLKRLDNYADTWIRMRTGAQASFPELQSVRSFMATTSDNPVAFKAAINMMTKDLMSGMDRWNNTLSDQGIRPQTIRQEEQAIRAWLSSNGKPFSRKYIDMIKNNPEALERVRTYRGR